MSKRKQRVRFLMVTKHVDAPNWKDEPFDMLLPVKSIKQIRVFERHGKFNVEVYTVSDVAYYVWTTHTLKGEAYLGLRSLHDYLEGGL